MQLIQPAIKIFELLLNKVPTPLGFFIFCVLFSFVNYFHSANNFVKIGDLDQIKSEVKKIRFENHLGKLEEMADENQERIYEIQRWERKGEADRNDLIRLDQLRIEKINIERKIKKLYRDKPS